MLSHAPPNNRFHPTAALRKRLNLAIRRSSPEAAENLSGSLKHEECVVKAKRYYFAGLAILAGLVLASIVVLGSIPVRVQAQPLAREYLSTALAETRKPISASDVFTTYLPIVLDNYTYCPAPIPLSPTNGSLLNTLIPEFVTNINYPTIEYSADPVFATFSYARFDRPANNLSPTTVYYWRTRTTCLYNVSPYSSVFTFTTGSGGTILPAPVLISPPYGASDVARPVTFAWSDVSGAIDYQLWTHQVGTSVTFVQALTQTSVTLFGTPNATIEWWVIARNDYAYSPASSTWWFTTASLIEDRE